MALQFTEIDGTPLFTFHKHEYPESLPIDWVTHLNEIEYPDSQYTNQIMGSKVDDIQFGGRFYGVWISNGKQENAMERSESIVEKVMNKPIYIVYNVGEFEEGSPNINSTNRNIFKQLVIIKDYKRKFNNHFDVEYELTLKPHQKQEVAPPGIIDLNLGIDGTINSMIGHGNKVIKSIEKIKSRPQKTQAAQNTTNNAESPGHYNITTGTKDAVRIFLGKKPLGPRAAQADVNRVTGGK